MHAVSLKIIIEWCVFLTILDQNNHLDMRHVSASSNLYQTCTPTSQFNGGSYGSSIPVKPARPISKLRAKKCEKTQAARIHRGTLQIQIRKYPWPSLLVQACKGPLGPLPHTLEVAHPWTPVKSKVWQFSTSISKSQFLHSNAELTGNYNIECRIPQWNLLLATLNGRHLDLFCKERSNKQCK